MRAALAKKEQNKEQRRLVASVFHARTECPILAGYAPDFVSVFKGVKFVEVEISPFDHVTSHQTEREACRFIAQILGHEPIPAGETLPNFQEL